MKKLSILVDCDVVLNNLLENWVDFLNKRHNANANPDDISIWDLRCIYPTLSEEEVLQPLSENIFWETLIPHPLSVEYTKRMIDDGHNVTVVTAVAVYQTLPAKLDWLFKNYPFFKLENVIMANKKQMITGDVLIDDAVHNLEGGQYFKILFDCPQNRKYDTKKNGMVRVYSMKEAYETIKLKF